MSRRNCKDYDFDQDELYVDLTHLYPPGQEPDHLKLHPTREETLFFYFLARANREV